MRITSDQHCGFSRILYWLVVWVDGQVGWKYIFVFGSRRRLSGLSSQRVAIEWAIFVSDDVDYDSKRWLSESGGLGDEEYGGDIGGHA